jgi:hypothetical protein
MNTFMTRLLTSLLPALVLVFMGSPDAASAQTPADGPYVAINNESPHQVRAYVYHDDNGDRTLLGWIGATSLEFYRVPPEAMTEDGTFHVAIQQLTPLPQLGVPSTYEFLHSGRLELEPHETARITVTPLLELETVVVD